MLVPVWAVGGAMVRLGMVILGMEPRWQYHTDTTALHFPSNNAELLPVL